MKKTAAKDGLSRIRLPTKWIGRGLVCATVAVGIVTLAIGLWKKLRPHVSSQPEYLVELRNIEITPPPNWIRADVKAEVLRDGGFPQQLSILDESLKELLTQSFSLHPWIAAVERIETSYPAKITLSVVYRRPVAMVEVHDGLLPVDASGVLLPPEDFTPEQALRYPRISGLAGSPLGPIGTRWGNPIVDAAAKLAELLEPAWRELNLHHIASQSGASGENPATVMLQIVTRERTEFLWGRSPGMEGQGEAKANVKLVRLQDLAKVHQGLDKVPEAQRDLSQSVPST
jgi:hypothetical protein